MDTSSVILLASPEIERRRALAAILNQEGWDTVCASRISECRDVVAAQKITLVLCERCLADGTYRDLLDALRSLNHKVRVIVMSRLADWDEYLEVLQHGGFELIASPCRPTDVMWAIIQARREEQGQSSRVVPSEEPEFAEHSAPLRRMAHSA
jgi:DNA-binding NtrC family response regulator